jgi:hypothetical protein
MRFAKQGRAREIAKRLECVELAPALVRPANPKAPASWTHSMRLASLGAGSRPPRLSQAAPAGRKIGVNFCATRYGANS